MARGENPSQVERMRAQGYTEEEIEDMLKCDKEIDRGADLFPLSAELEQGAKKARRADRTDTPKKADGKRKIDPDKVEIIGVLNDAICDLADDVGEVVNEREFLFTYNGRKFKVTLSCPRNQGQDFALPIHIREWAGFEYLFAFGKKIFQTFFDLPIDKSPVM